MDVIPRLHTLYLRLSSNDFVRHNTVAFVGSIFVAALNYLYYPVLGRIMSPADFGEVQAINSLSTQIVIFLGVFNFLTVSAIAKYDNDQTRNQLISELEKVATFITIAVLAVLLIGSFKLMSFFQFGSIYPLLALFLSILVAVPNAFRAAYLQGKRHFTGASLTSAISAGGKLIFGLALVLIGWHAAGAVLGMVMAQILSLLYAAHLSRRLGWARPAGFRHASRPDLGLLRPELIFGLLVFATTFGFSVFMTLDILAVKHWFDPHDAGLYAGIETLGRIVFFISGSVAGVMLPSVKPGRISSENRRLLLRSLALITALAAPVLAVFALAPQLVVGTLMGPKFLVYQDLLLRLGLFNFLLSLINLFFNYYLARRQTFIGFASILGLGGAFAILSLHHGTPSQVVDSLLAGALLILLLIGLFRYGKKLLSLRHSSKKIA